MNDSQLPRPDTRSMLYGGRTTDYVDGYENGYERGAEDTLEYIKRHYTLIPKSESAE